MTRKTDSVPDLYQTRNKEAAQAELTVLPGEEPKAELRLPPFGKTDALVVRGLAPLESLDLIPEVDPKLQEIENLAVQAGILKQHVMRGGGGLAVEMRQTIALKMLTDYLTDDIMETYFMPLMNNQEGFKTDRPSSRQPTTYSIETVRRCAVSCLLVGAHVTGNEMNIIGGGNKASVEEADRSGFAYFTVEFFDRKAHEVPGVRDMSCSVGLPKVKGSTANVMVYIKFNYQPEGWEYGMPYGLEREFPIRHNEGAMHSSDQSKARRVGMKEVYKFLIGSEMTPPDGEVEEMVMIGGKPGDSSLSIVADAGTQFIPWEPTLQTMKKALEARKVRWVEFLKEAARLNGGDVDHKEIPVSLMPALSAWVKDAVAAAK